MCSDDHFDDFKLDKHGHRMQCFCDPFPEYPDKLPGTEKELEDALEEAFKCAAHASATYRKARKLKQLKNRGNTEQGLAQL